MTTRPSRFLRNVLILDAVATGGTGLLLTFFSSFLTGLLQVPGALLFYAQALVVAGFAELQFVGLRRSTAAAA